MRILSASALVVVLLAPAGAVARSAPSSAAVQTETETVDRTVTIGESGRLKLKNFSGDVRIPGTLGPDVVIHAVRRAKRDRLDNIKLEITTSGDSVSIEANQRASGWREQNNNVVETDFEIKVPRGTTLDIYTFSGKIDVRGVTGKIEAQTFSANIDIDVTEAAEMPELTAETFSGDIRAHVPPSASGRVRFNSFSGSVRSELPISTTSGGGRRTDVNGDIGTGQGPTLRFKTFSGDLRISK